MGATPRLLRTSASSGLRRRTRCGSRRHCAGRVGAQAPRRGHRWHGRPRIVPRAREALQGLIRALAPRWRGPIGCRVDRSLHRRHRHGAGVPPVVRPPTSRWPAADRASDDAQAQYPGSGERTRCSPVRAGQDFVSNRAQLDSVWLTRRPCSFPIGGGHSNCEEGTSAIATFAVRSSLEVAIQRIKGDSCFMFTNCEWESFWRLGSARLLSRGARRGLRPRRPARADYRRATCSSRHR